MSFSSSRGLNEGRATLVEAVRLGVSEISIFQEDEFPIREGVCSRIRTSHQPGTVFVWSK